MNHRNNHRKIKTAALAFLLAAGTALNVFAAVRTGTGGGAGSYNTVTGAEQNTAEPSGSAVEYYEFDGKKYVIESDWGTHYLTGFSPNADGSRKTRSGAQARAGYTVSSTAANLGKVILIRAESAMPECTDIHRYDGVYKCEDTGGAAVETGTAKTGNTPVVDIFFDTAAEAAYVSQDGWITARIYILKEVQ